MQKVPKSKRRLGLGQTGSLQLPLVVALFVIAIGGFGIWGFLRHWRFLMETQLRLDRCVGRTAIEFRSTLNSLEFANLEIDALRVSIEAAKLEPWLIPPLAAALQLVVGYQEVLRYKWQVKRARWLVSQGCDFKLDRAWPLPDLEYVRDPPDSTGPQRLHWPVEMPTQFNIQLQHPPRGAAACIRGESDGSVLSIKKNWIAKWNAPRRFYRPTSR